MFKIISVFLSIILATNGFAATSNILNVGNAGINGTDWAQYTPSFTNTGTASAVDFWYRRVGDSLEIRGSVTFAAGGSAAEMRIGLPSGLTIKSGITGIKHGGSVQFSNSSTSTFRVGVESGVNYLTVLNNASSSFGKINGDAFSGLSMLITAYSIPISGWTTQAGLNTRILSFAFAGNSSGSANCTSSPCTNVSNPSSDVTNATRGGSGDYTINFSRSFSSQPVCTAIANNVGTGQSKCSQVWTSGSGSSVRIACETDSAVTLICTGN